MRLEAKDLSFRYHKGNRQILNHVSVSLDSSDRLGLAAPSGFGKTTFCKILAGYEQPDEGQVLLDGKPLSEYKGYCPVQLIWQHPQEAVNPRRKMKTVLEEGGVLDERLIHGLGIEKEWMERYPGELSGGELQRFCIARALGEKTSFLLADEITAGSDHTEPDMEFSAGGSTEPGDRTFSGKPFRAAASANLYRTDPVVE